ncbi:hypothetical protein HYW20_03050 [Candidatus Woesearchaeota archaeon]|nr:hypothetical protein [Candidatus Woesearchaeota archaeon]
MDEESHKLGGNIELSGFRDMDSSSMVIIKKLVGTYARKISEHCKNLQTLHITLKPIHEREKSEKYEIHAKVIDDGKVFASEIVDRNLFVAVDSALKKIINEFD